MEHEPIYDVIGIGIGPFNLGLAALLQNTECRGLFFERKEQFNWHPGMLLDGTTLQVPFLADLVTMADPANRFSYLQYLHEHGRLYHFYFLENFQIPRTEFNHYCQWVASQLPELFFGSDVKTVETDGQGMYKVTVRSSDGTLHSYKARNVVAGTGTRPYVPQSLQIEKEPSVFHSSSYKERREELMGDDSITIIGSGQSAAEIFYDLLSRQREDGYELNWITRSKGFYPMEYSKLGLEHFSPDYTKYFYSLEPDKKRQVLKKQGLLYKGISFNLISDIYGLLYERSACGKRPKVRLQALTELESIEKRGERFELKLLQTEQNIRESALTDTVVLATGYEPFVPECLAPLDLEKDEHGQLIVSENYRLVASEQMNGDVFVQNGELHTHGVGAPDLGLGAYRNAVIINQIAGRDVFKLHDRNVFQQFGMQDTGKEKYAHEYL